MRLPPVATAMRSSSCESRARHACDASQRMRGILQRFKQMCKQIAADDTERLRKVQARAGQHTGSVYTGDGKKNPFYVHYISLTHIVYAFTCVPWSMLQLTKVLI